MGVSIKDTVHRYVELDEMEALIVDLPWFQRLRRVKQNDVSSSTYPTMQGTRFEHSLGAMSVAGRCMEAALFNSDANLKRKFLDQLRAEILASIRKASFGLDSAIFRSWQQEHGSPLKQNDEQLPVRLARLYGLLHDIGHPPYSHLMERCIKFGDIYPKAGAVGAMEERWHEYNSFKLVEDVLTNRVPESHRPYLALTGLLMRKKAKELERELPALASVKTLVDAVIDADRMDYVPRDGRTSGAEFGRYDLYRLVNAFRLHFAKDTEQYLVRPHLKGLSAIESLLQERHKVYRWVHFHPRVILSKALTRYALAELAQGVVPKVRPDPAFFRYENYYAEERSNVPYLLLGDRYVDGLMEEAFKALVELGAPNVRQRRLLTALRVLVLREKRGLIVWKRLEGYAEFDRLLRNQIEKVAEERDPKPNLMKATERHGTTANWIADSVMELKEDGQRFLRDVEAEMNAGDGTEWHLLEPAEGFSTAAERFILADRPDKSLQAIPFQSVSLVAESIAQAWKNDIHMYCFRLCDANAWPTRDRREVESARSDSIEAAAEALGGTFGRFYRTFGVKLRELLEQ